MKRICMTVTKVVRLLHTSFSWMLIFRLKTFPQAGCVGGQGSRHRRTVGQTATRADC